MKKKLNVVLFCAVFSAGSLAGARPAFAQFSRGRSGGACGIRSCGPTPYLGACAPRGSFGFSPFVPWGGRLCSPRVVSPCRPYIVTAPVVYYPYDATVSSLIVTTPPPLYSSQVSVYSHNAAAYAATPNEPSGDTSPPAPEAYSLKNPARPGDTNVDSLAESLWRIRKQREAAAAAARPDTTLGARETVDALARGDTAFVRGDYNAARDEYVRALVAGGDEARARVALGLAELARGDYADAGRTLRMGIARTAHMPDQDMDLRKAFPSAGELDRARRGLETFLWKNAEYADGWFLLGFVRYYSGDRTGAIAALQRYESLPGRDPSVAPFINQVKRPS